MMKKFRMIFSYALILGWVGGCTYGYATNNENSIHAGAFLFLAALILSDWR